MLFIAVFSPCGYPVHVCISHSALNDCHIAPKGTLLYTSDLLLREPASLIVEFLIFTFRLVRVAPMDPLLRLFTYFILPKMLSKNVLQNDSLTLFRFLVKGTARVQGFQRCIRSTAMATEHRRRTIGDLSVLYMRLF